MIVLGFDTATSATAVGLLVDGERALERRDDPAQGAHPGHATRLLSMARELLDESGVGWRAVERVAVGVGPGAFTGLRVGVATARGLAQSLGIGLAGVSTPRALARAAFEGSGADAVLAVLDARRGEVFAGAYIRSGEQGAEAELQAPLALAPERLAKLLERVGERAAEGSRWLAVGDGVERYARDLEGLALQAAPQGSPLNRVGAIAVCELGALEGPSGAPRLVVPDYVRRPDAELALEAAHAGAGGRG